MLAIYISFYLRCFKYAAKLLFRDKVPFCLIFND